MRIGMVMDTSFPPDARVENEIRSIVRAGHKVALLCTDYGSAVTHRKGPGAKSAGGAIEEEDSGRIIHGHGERDEIRRKPFRSAWEALAPGRVEFERETGDLAEIWRIHPGQWLYKLSALVYTVPIFRFWMTPVIRTFIRQSQCELLHIHDMVIAEAAINANKPFGLPVVLDLHENRPEILSGYPHLKRFPGKWLIRPQKWRRKQRELMHRADHVVFVTDEARREARDRDGLPLDRSTSLPNVVWPDDFDRTEVEAAIKKAGTGRFNILYIGDTSLRRGTLTLLKAVRRARTRIPRLQLWLVGSSSEDDVLRAYIRQHDLSDTVRMEGWQSPGRLPDYLAVAQVCVSPLLRNRHHDTTYANKLFQYMAAGRAVVASDCPAQADVIRRERCGLVYPASESQELANSICALSERDSLRIMMGQNGRRAVQKRWNWEIVGERLVRLYGRLS